MTKASPLRIYLLGLMVLQNTAWVLVGRYTNAVAPPEEKYVVNHLIITCEITKLFLSCFFEYITTEGQLYKSIKENVFDRPLEALKITVPSLLFLIQNSLLYIALANLSGPLFQVTYQARLLQTAFVSVHVLKRQYTLKQWVCLTFLAVGVSIVLEGVKREGSESQVEGETVGTGHKTLHPEGSSEIANQNTFVGLQAVGLAGLCSALSGVYMELLFKKPTHYVDETDTVRAPTSLWNRNIQMSFLSICIGLVQFKYLKGPDSEKPFMHGFTPWVYMLVCLQSGGGLLVAAVIKYADNVLKGMATGISVISVSFLSFLIFGTTLNAQFFIGALIVLGSVYFFSNQLPCEQRWVEAESVETKAKLVDAVDV